MCAWLDFFKTLDYVELRVRGATLDNIVLLIQQILFSPQT